MLRFVFATTVLLCFTTIASAEPPDLAGKWSGYWVSEKNGHMGPLQGTFTRLDEDTYRVRYRGRFAKIVPFFYSTKMHVAGTSEDAVFLTASQNLGPFLGTFRTNATATATSFDAGFSSRGDSGRFVLTRKK